VGRAKADLINEKITRLIEILKAIAAEQGKMEKLLASQGGKRNNKKLLDALADLKRKANVNISRSDSILKKLK
jgi:predicted lipoprotein